MAKPEKLQAFTWQGSDKRGNVTKGEITATSLLLAKAQLRQQGIIPLKVRKKSKPLFGGDNKFKSKDIALFTRQLSTMLDAGIPIMQSLQILGQNARNDTIRLTILNVKTAIESGNTFSGALAQYPKYFNGLYCNLILAGEQSGTLDNMLNRIATYREKTETIKGKIKKALFYPTAVIIVALLVTSGMLIFVVPEFAQIYKNFGAELPYATRVVISLSDILQKYWWLVGLSLGAGVYALIIGKRRNPKIAEVIDKLILKIPVVGKILQKAIVARFARTLSTTFAAGLPLVDALQAAAEASGNIIYAKAIYRIREDVQTGRPLNQAITKFPIFPTMVTQMIAVGEEAGSLDFMLTKIADFYEEDVNNAVDSLSSLLEPVIMVVLGVLIGGLVIAMYMPIFKLGSVI